MYTVQQLQALDYLLKRITNDSHSPFYNRNLKIVINLDNSYWYGDFVQFNSNFVHQLFIEDDGDINSVRFNPTNNDAPIVLKKVWDTFIALVRNPAFWTNPIHRINDLPLLLNTLMKIVDRAEITEEDSPIYPYLLNAKSINSNSSLPLINLSDTKVKIISLIELADQ
jgi:hypothetical protein